MKPHEANEMTSTAVEEINGQWFVSVDSSDIVESELRFQNRGNGVELIAPDGVHGPFDTEAEAQSWLDEYMKDCE